MVYHKISPERLRKLWLYHRAYWQGRSDAILDQQSGKYVYTRLRTLSSRLLGSAISAGGDEFDEKVITRISTGYLYQLLAGDEADSQDVRKLRVLATVLSEILKTSAKTIRSRDDEIHALNMAIAELLNSMSWKITSPLRAIHAMLTRRRNKRRTRIF